MICLFFFKIIRKVRESLTYIGELDPPTQAIVRSSYEDAIHVTLWFSAIMAVFALLSSVFIKEKPLPNKKWILLLLLLVEALLSLVFTVNTYCFQQQSFFFKASFPEQSSTKVSEIIIVLNIGLDIPF